MSERVLLLGAYAASRPEWNVRQLMAFYTALAERPQVSGLELPVAQLELFVQNPVLLDGLPADWTFEVTTLPETMTKMNRDVDYGLASPAPAGRCAAVADVLRVRTLAHALNDHVGRQAVREITVVSAPTRVADGPAFARSLSDLADGGWGEVGLQAEHCDAFVPSRQPAKGFLPLDAELEALTDPSVQIVINWGRSAIEARDAAAPVAHVREARRRGRLGRLVLCGCGATGSAWGLPWADTHVPPAAVQPSGGAAHASLLTETRIAETLGAAGPDVPLGAKVSVRPRDADLATRVAFIDATLDVLMGVRHAVCR